MNCVETLDLMGAALEGSVPGEMRPDFDFHIEHCCVCRVFLEQLTSEDDGEQGATGQGRRARAHARLREAVQRWTLRGV